MKKNLEKVIRKLLKLIRNYLEGGGEVLPPNGQMKKNLCISLEIFRVVLTIFFQCSLSSLVEPHVVNWGCLRIFFSWLLVFLFFARVSRKFSISVKCLLSALFLSMPKPFCSLLCWRHSHEKA